MRNAFPVLALFGLIILGACNSTATGTEATSYLRQGDSLSDFVQKKLSGTLMEKMKAEGPAGAIAFCNLEALSITTSAETEGIRIQRVARQFRNTNNAADSADRVVFENFSNAKAMLDTLVPVIKDLGDHYVYYRPILLQQNCVTCHGVPGKEIPGGLMAQIDSLYPRDQAKGFAVGDLRGMWRIEFQK